MYGLLEAARIANNDKERIFMMAKKQQGISRLVYNWMPPKLHKKTLQIGLEINFPLVSPSTTQTSFPIKKIQI
jgi:hypothetical protein